MKKLIQTLKHIWAIDELRNKIIVTLALVLTYRIGTQITLPGIDPNKIEAASAAAHFTGGPSRAFCEGPGGLAGPAQGGRKSGNQKAPTRPAHQRRRSRIGPWKRSA